MKTPLSDIRILIEQGQYGTALSRLKNDMRNVSPAEGEGHILRALCLAHLDQADLAEDFAREGLTLSQNKALGYFVLSRVLSLRNDHGGALSAIEKALQLDPERADFWCQKAMVERARRRRSDALDSTHHALTLDPRNVLAMSLHIDVLKSMERIEEADELLVELAEISANPVRSPIAKEVTSPTCPDYWMVRRSLEDARLLSLDSNGIRKEIRDSVTTHLSPFPLLHQYVEWLRKNHWFPFTLMLLSIIAGCFISWWVTPERMGWRFLVVQFQALLLFSYLNWIAKSLENIVLSLHSTGRYGLSRDEQRDTLVVGGILVFAIVLMTGRFTDTKFYLQGISTCLLIAVPASHIFCQRVSDARWLVTFASVVVFLTGLAPVLFVSFVEVLPGSKLVVPIQFLMRSFWFFLGTTVLLLWLITPTKE